MADSFLGGVQTAVNLGNLQRLGIQQERADIAAKDEQRKQQLDEVNTELNIYKSLQGDPNVPLSARMGLAMKLAKRAGLTNVTPDVFFAHQDAIHNLMDAYQAKDGEKIITALKTLPTDVTADVFKQLESAQKPQQLASFEGLAKASYLPEGSGAALQASSQGQQEVFQALVDPTQKARTTYLNTQAMKIAVDAQLSAARVNEVQNKVKQYRDYTAPLEEMKLVQEAGKTEELDEKRNLLRASNKAFAKWYDDRPRLIQTAQGELDQLRARATQLAPWVVNSKVGIALPEGKTPAMVQAELLNADRDIELKEREVAFLENPTPQTFKIYEDSYKSLNQHLTRLVKESDQIASQRLELSNAKYRTGRADLSAQTELEVAFLRNLGSGLSDVQAGLKAMEDTHAKFPEASLDATKLKNPEKTGQTINVNTMTTANEEAQRDFVKSTRTTYDQLKFAPQMLNNIEKAKALVPGAAGFMGPGGETLLTAAKFLNNRLGMQINTEGIQNAEELRSRIFFNILDNLKKMDAQPSQLQQLIMMESLGNLGTDPSALSHVLDAFGEVIRDKVQVFNEEVKGAEGRGVKFPYDPTIKIPKAAGKKGATPPTADIDALVEKHKTKP